MRTLLWLCLCTLPLTGADAIDDAIQRRISFFPGQIGVYAKNLATGAVYAHHADERVRTASTIKLPILIATFEAVAEGQARWTDLITLHKADMVSGSGVLTEFSDGVRLPLRDLVHLMIVLSDNTATNLVLDQVTAEAVNRRMERLGLTATKSLRKVLSGKPSGVSAAGRLPENQRFGLGVSTPYEMVTLLEKLYRGELVSKEASAEMIAILKRQQDRQGIGRQLRGVEIASKAGALDHLRSDVGIVYTKGGPIAMAITVEGIPEVDYGNDNRGLLIISDLSNILLELR